jgi:hypothetical protein
MGRALTTIALLVVTTALAVGGCGGSDRSTGGTRIVDRKNPLTSKTKCGAVPQSTEGETELRGVVFQALVEKRGANVMNQKPDLVAHDLGRVQAYCRSHGDATLGQVTSKIVGVAVHP